MVEATAVLGGMKVFDVAPGIGLLKSVVSHVSPEYHWYVGVPTPSINVTSRAVVEPSKQTVCAAKG